MATIGVLEQLGGDMPLGAAFDHARHCLVGQPPRLHPLELVE
jgi:hypothetical protein